MEETVHDEPNKDSDAQTDMPNDSLRVVAVEDLLESTTIVINNSCKTCIWLSMYVHIKTVTISRSVRHLVPFK